MKMTGREAIEWYLDTHGSFNAADVVRALGVTRKQVDQASNKMRENGEIVLKQKAWRCNTYVYAEDDEGQPISRDGINTIFQECRKSPAMRRVLAVYGRVSP
ncbi:protein ren [Leclercia adecarboxylata]|uniref:protein ren n=2 Tax=Leclercia TaxID=83654 RepID=UPI0021F15CC8|nr:protein ren [Leclercia adecarboxylata]UYM55278.1 protein ren [Leclercia adecarboxylata]